MNKKFSTLLTAGLLMAGSALNSAWADKLPIGGTAATALENGKSYVLVQSNHAYGFTAVDDEGKISEGFVVSPGTSNSEVDTEMIPAYIWKVSISQIGASYSYSFTNALTGQILRYNTTTGSEKIELDTNVAASKTSGAFVFDDYAAYSGTAKHLIGEKYIGEKYISNAPAGGTAYVGISNGSGQYRMEVGVEAALAATDFYLVESQSVTSADELNTLYNNKGVSFEVNGKDVVGNIFADKRLEAYYSNGVNIDPANDLKIPAGMYFFTDKVMDGNKIDWLNSSVLAVSSTETVEVTNADRAAGKGFEVVEVRIGDMNLYTGTTNAKKSSASEVSIYNAAFTVDKSYTSSYPYALTVNGFRYQKDASKDDHAATAVRLGVLTHGGVNYLASQKADDPVYTFKKVATTAIKGIEFLNTDATVAAYGIRFLNGNANDVKTVYGKYLTIGAGTGTYEWVAKGDVLADLNTPSFQFIITAVNGTNVTFTNRETGANFTATLFPTDEENVYTWAIGNGDGQVKSVYVNTNTYAVQAAAAAAYQTQLSDATVELIPVAVDKYAGFTNVDDKTLVTLSFARDNYITSNKVYATVVYNTTDRKYHMVDGNYFATNLYGAAQWQLVKAEKPVVLAARTYVWNNEDKITSVAKGDTLAAYTYQFQYVVDGTETGYKMPLSVTTNIALNNDGGNFFIKENVDGSISLLRKFGSLSFDKENEITTEFSSTTGLVSYTSTRAKAYAYESKATDMRVYLNIEAPEVSLPATATYVTLQSELGNYVSMNAEKDGIVVSNEPLTMRVFATDEAAVVPSFLISTGWNAESTSRDFLFNPADSVDYLVAAGTYDKKYQVREDATKAIFKAGILNETADTLTTAIKGKVANVAAKADNKGTLGGLNRFKFQIISAGDDYYRIRQANAGYLAAINGKLIFGADAAEAMLFTIADTVSPTANEAIAAEGVQVIGGQGAVTVQGAAGKVITVANILGQTIANQVAASDNVTIAAPAGIVVVAVEGEATKVVVK